jgi:hypothetical protein
MDNFIIIFILNQLTLYLQLYYFKFDLLKKFYVQNLKYFFFLFFLEDFNVNLLFINYDFIDLTVEKGIL